MVLGVVTDSLELLDWLLILSTLGSGMMAGLFVSFSTFIMKALASLKPAEGMKAMQAINRVIIRPSFLIVFMGTGVILILTCFVTSTQHQVFWYLLVATISYVVACLASTIAFNVPLNNRLDSFNSDQPEGLDFWEYYLTRWTQWNHVRSAACLLSTLLTGFSLSIT